MLASLRSSEARAALGSGMFCREVSTSTSWRAAYEPSRAVDGNAFTYWASQLGDEGKPSFEASHRPATQRTWYRHF